MSTISIQDINPVGADLLSDEETFLNEVNDTDQDYVKGGVTPLLAVGMSVAASYGITKAGVAITKAIF